MVRIIEFRNVRNNFQDKLKEDVNEVHSSKELDCFCVQFNVNKALRNVRHRYYNRRLSNNITSSYRKCENGVNHRLDKEIKKIAESLNLSKKMEYYACRPAFIILKYHKPNF